MQNIQSMNIPWIDSPFFEQLIPTMALSAEEEKLVCQYVDQGFVVLDTDIDEATIEEAARTLKGHYTGSATGYTGGGRVMDAWKFNAAVRRIASSEKVLKTLKLLYQRDPIPFQTLNFEVGTQQKTHSDMIHFNSIPFGYMCGVWFALEDTDAENGPLHYYPGSHKLPFYSMHDIGLPSSYDFYKEYENFIEQMIEQKKLKKFENHIKKGQALIWAANLLHGGCPILDSKRTRLSQVTHYYFKECIYYQPGSSDPYVGIMQIKDVIDIRNNKRVPNLYNGKSFNVRRLKRHGFMKEFVYSSRYKLNRFLEKKF